MTTKKIKFFTYIFTSNQRLTFAYNDYYYYNITTMVRDSLTMVRDLTRDFRTNELLWDQAWLRTVFLCW